MFRERYRGEVRGTGGRDGHDVAVVTDRETAARVSRDAWESGRSLGEYQRV